MRISVCAVGRLKGGPESRLFDDYLARSGALGRAVGITAVALREVAESRLPQAAQRRGQEAGRLVGLLSPEASLVMLDETGKSGSSRDLALLIGQAADRGVGELAFAIGGPDGHGPAVRERATASIAFGRMTWPHRLIRIMLAEQIYRSVTILVNHPYHRD